MNLFFLLLLLAVSIWWVAIGIVVAIWPRSVQAILQPFADWFKRKHAFILICIGLGLGCIFIAAMLMGFGTTLAVEW